MKMDKNPDVWAAFFAWFAAHRSEIGYASLASLMTLLRGAYTGRQPWWRRIIEAGMCAIFAFYIKDGLSLAGLDPSWASLGSVFIGFLGVDFIRQIADKRAGIQQQE
ncbi:phage holin, lambda family [Edwardsiella piscicida]|nr:phage holin, lambda family [Edwardsiella piscicida]